MLLLLLILCGDIEPHPGPQQLTREEFQRHFLTNKGMKIAHQNIRGIISNFDMLQEFISTHSGIDILSLSETHLSDENAKHCTIYGYNFV